MTPSPEPAAKAAPAPEPITYTSFINDFINAVSSWGLSGFIAFMLSSMLMRWLSQLRERTDGWMALAKAREAAAAAAQTADRPEQAAKEERPAAAPEAAPDGTSAPEADAEANAKPATAKPAATAAQSEAEDDDLPPQWTLPFTWPERDPGAPGKRRPFGWLYDMVDPLARPLRQALDKLLVTPDMVRLFTYCPVARIAWIPACWMLGVDGNPVRFPGQTPPPHRKPPARVKLSKRERWWRALARDPDPQPRYIQREKSEHGGWRGIFQLRPKGNVFMDYEPFPDHIQRKT